MAAAGRALWKRLMAADADGGLIEYSLTELVTADLACRTADSIAGLEQALVQGGLIVRGSQGQDRLSPIPAEVRLQRVALARLLSMLAVPEPGEEVGRSPASRRAQRAVDVRWRRAAAAREARSRG